VGEAARPELRVSYRAACVRKGGNGEEVLKNLTAVYVVGNLKGEGDQAFSKVSLGGRTQEGNTGGSKKNKKG